MTDKVTITNQSCDQQLIDERFKRFLSDNPDIRKALRETLDELSTPQNVQKMAMEITSVIKGLEDIRESLTTIQTRGGQ